MCFVGFVSWLTSLLKFGDNYKRWFHNSTKIILRLAICAFRQFLLAEESMMESLNAFSVWVMWDKVGVVSQNTLQNLTKAVKPCVSVRCTNQVSILLYSVWNSLFISRSLSNFTLLGETLRHLKCRRYPLDLMNANKRLLKIHVGLKLTVGIKNVFAPNAGNGFCHPSLWWCGSLLDWLTGKKKTY